MTLASNTSERTLPLAKTLISKQIKKKHYTARKIKSRAEQNDATGQLRDTEVAVISHSQAQVSQNRLRWKGPLEII